MIMGERIVAMVHKNLGPLKDGPAYIAYYDRLLAFCLLPLF